MKTPIILAVALVLPSLMADEVKLKDGKVYQNCTVELETEDSVTILVPVSGGIKDSLTIKKEAVESITKASEDELKAASLRKRYASPENLSQAELEEGLKDLDKIQKKNPSGPLNEAATELRGGMESALEEKKIQAAQDQEAAEAEAKAPASEQYDMKSARLLKRFKSLVASGKGYRAMAVYDKLSKDYPGSAALAEAYPVALKLVVQLDKTLVAQIKQKEKELEKERNDLGKFSESVRSDTRLKKEERDAKMAEYVKKQETTRNRENKLLDQHRTRLKKIRERGDRWYEPDVNSVDSLRDLRLVSRSEAESLQRQDPESGAGSAALKKAWELYGQKKYDEAYEAVTEVRAARVPREFYEDLDIKIRDGIKETRAQEREERAEAARKAREERDKAAKEKAQPKK